MALTVTRKQNSTGQLEQASVDWVSDSGGDVNDTIAGVEGTIEGVLFVPDAGGTQPTAAYDVVLNDADGTDVLGGAGANLINSAAVRADTDPTSTPVFPIPTMGLLTLVVSAAGSLNGGTIRILFRK